MKQITELLADLGRLDGLPSSMKSEPQGVFGKSSRVPPIDRNNFKGDLKSPEAASLIEELSILETKAATLAAYIRKLAEEPGDHSSQITQAKQDLKKPITNALQTKFKLEQLQVTAMEDRLKKLKTQMERRKSKADQIVERRTTELIEGDVERWTPKETEPIANAVTQSIDVQTVPEPNPTAVQSPNPNSSADQDLTRSPTAEAEEHPKLSGAPPQMNLPQTTFSNLANFESSLLTMNHEVDEARLKYQYTEKLYQQKVVSKNELELVHFPLKQSEQKRKAIIDAYKTMMRDLKLQLDDAQDELEFAENQYQRFKNLPRGTVPLQTINQAEDRQRRAKLPLARFKLQYEFYKKAGEVAGIPNINFTNSDSEIILVAKKDLEPGVQLDLSNVEYKTWPSDKVPTEAIRINLNQDLSNRFVKTRIIMGCPITNSILVTKDENTAVPGTQ